MDNRKNGASFQSYINIGEQSDTYDQGNNGRKQCGQTTRDRDGFRSQTIAGHAVRCVNSVVKSDSKTSSAVSQGQGAKGVATEPENGDSNSQSTSAQSTSATHTETDFEIVDEEQVRDLYVSGGQQSQHISRLCGFLNKSKVGARSRKSKKRWFVFSEATCKLLYYRTPQDFVPLGEIDIACASFSYEVDSTGTHHMFEIRSHGNTYCLEAPDGHTRKFWLQELQQKRRHHSRLRFEDTQSSYTQNNEAGESDKGLVPINQPLTPSPSAGCLESRDCGEKEELVPPVESPQNTVGWVSAHTSSTPGIKDLSISNIKTEIKNIVGAMKRKSRMEVDTGHEEDPGVAYASEAIDQDATQNRDSSSSVDKFPLAILRRKLSRPKALVFGSRSSSASDMSPDCQKCRQLHDMVEMQGATESALREELQATKDQVKLLQKHIDKVQRFTTTQHQLGEHDHVQLLCQRDSVIVEMEHLLSYTQEEKENVKAKFRSLNHEVETLNDLIAAYRDSIVSKDEIVVTLSKRIEELKELTDRRSPGGSDEFGDAVLVPRVVDQSEADNLKEEVIAFKEQNCFLSKEILELNRLREEDQYCQNQMSSKMKDLEKRYYDLKSRYLRCIQELSAPTQGSSDARTEEMVTRLLLDAMETDHSTADNHMQGSVAEGEKYDKYGFSYLLPGSDTDIECHANSLQRRSEELEYKAKSEEREMSVRVKWETFLNAQGELPLLLTPELKALVREGVPSEYRHRVWRTCIDARVGKERQHRGPNYYSHLVSEAQHAPESFRLVTHQVELDLLRTLPTNRHYDSIHSEGIPKLRNVLLAYALHNPRVGYCQGLNRLAAIALFFLNEEDAFWCLVAIVDHILPPDYYCAGLMGAHTDQRVLKDLVGEKLPRLAACLATNELDLTLFTFNWFLTIFVDSIPIESILRIWDTFLFEGSKVMFRYGIAFLKYRESDLLKQEPISLMRTLRSIGEHITDIDTVSRMAFHEINPFRLKYINNRRQFHLQKVQIELDDLHSLRRSQHERGSSMDVMSTECLSEDDL